MDRFEHSYSAVLTINIGKNNLTSIAYSGYLSDAIFGDLGLVNTFLNKNSN